MHAGLATHMIDYLMDAEFDLAASKRLRAGEGEGHAVAYIHRHVMDAGKPVPVVPVFINTYYPPVSHGRGAVTGWGRWCGSRWRATRAMRVSALSRRAD